MALPGSIDVESARIVQYLSVDTLRTGCILDGLGAAFDSDLAGYGLLAYGGAPFGWPLTDVYSAALYGSLTLALTLELLKFLVQTVSETDVVTIDSVLRRSVLIVGSAQVSDLERVDTLRVG